MMFSNFQLDYRGRAIGITENYHDLEKIVLAFDDARAQRWAEAGFDEADRVSAVNREALANADPAKNAYRGLQVQLNRRFADGWALYNNVAWSETDTTGGGVWWNNTDSGYLELAHVNLSEAHLEDCQASQTEPDRRTGRARTFPEDCFARLSDFIGLPGSMINQRGPNHVYDRTWIYNSFGFKTWRIGNQDLTLGGHLTFQTGTPWYRSEGAGISATKTCAPGAGLRDCGPVRRSLPPTRPATHGRARRTAASAYGSSRRAPRDTGPRMSTRST